MASNARREALRAFGRARAVTRAGKATRERWASCARGGGLARARGRESVSRGAGKWKEWRRDARATFASSAEARARAVGGAVSTSGASDSASTSEATSETAKTRDEKTATATTSTEVKALNADDIDFGIIRTLGGYLWNDENPAAKRRVAAALSLLVASKVANVSVPFAFKYAIDGLSAQAGVATTGAAAIGTLPMTTIVATPAAMLVGYGRSRRSRQVV